MMGHSVPATVQSCFFTKAGYHQQSLEIAVRRAVRCAWTGTRCTGIESFQVDSAILARRRQPVINGDTVPQSDETDGSVRV